MYRWYYPAVHKKAEECLCVEQSRELFSDMRGEVGVLMLASIRAWAPPVDKLFEVCIQFGAVKVVHSKSIVTNMSLAWPWE